MEFIKKEKKTWKKFQWNLWSVNCFKKDSCTGWWVKKIAIVNVGSSPLLCRSISASALLADELFLLEANATTRQSGPPWVRPRVVNVGEVRVWESKWETTSLVLRPPRLFRFARMLKSMKPSLRSYSDSLRLWTWIAVNSPRWHFCFYILRAFVTPIFKIN